MHVDDETTTSNGPPSLTSPTGAHGGIMRIGGTRLPVELTLTIGGRTFSSWELDQWWRAQHDRFRGLERSAQPPPRAVLEFKAIRLREDLSNTDGGCSRGLPSYTEARFAGPAWPRAPRTRAHVDPGLAVRQRRGREALRRRKRFRDHARTGRR